MRERLLLLSYHLAGVFPLAAAGVAAIFSRRWREGFAERLGCGPEPPAGEGETVWIHGASVGEIIAAEGIAAGLLERRPRCRLVLSAFTVSGRETARKRFASFGSRVAFTLLPLDWDGIPGRALDRFRPSLFIILETELWPTLIRALSVRGIPVMLANGRLSERTFPRYRRLRTFFAPFLDRISIFCVRTAEDGERFRQLGVPAEKLRLAGNVKHDRRASGAPSGRAARWAARIRERKGERVIVAGSLRGGEDKIVLEAFARLRRSRPGLRLVIAPRHPASFDDRAIAATGLPWERWSESPEEGPGDGAVIVLLDTLGELGMVYGLADVAFVGGTLGGGEGHNILEPAFASVPVLFGPGHRGYRAEGEALAAAGGGFVTPDADAIVAAAADLLKDDGAGEEAGRRAGEAAARFGGALAATLSAAEELLEEKG